MTSFFTLGAEQHVGINNQLLKLLELIDWEDLRTDLTGLHKNEVNPQGGQTPYDSLKMFKAILLGQWHNLSDPKLEESLRVRLDFMLFTGFELGGSVPDETTLCRFRNKLIARGLDQRLFEKINRQLESYGLHIESAKGAVVDATIIESSARPRRVIEMNEDRSEEQASDCHELQSSDPVVRESVDPDARWLKKGRRCYFGYKGFVSVAEGSGFIQTLKVTSANVSEGGQLFELLGESSRLVYGDKAYASKKNRAQIKERGMKDRIMYKASRGHPLSHWQKRFNCLVSKRRYIVEQCFGTMKRRLGCARASYMTREKVRGQLHLKAMCFNLIKAVNLAVWAPSSGPSQPRLVST